MLSVLLTRQCKKMIVSSVQKFSTVVLVIARPRVQNVDIGILDI